MCPVSLVTKLPTHLHAYDFQSLCDSRGAGILNVDHICIEHSFMPGCRNQNGRGTAIFAGKHFSWRPQRNSSELCHMFRSEGDLKRDAQNLGFLATKN